jgi:hypothetical protein
MTANLKRDCLINPNQSDQFRESALFGNFDQQVADSSPSSGISHCRLVTSKRAFINVGNMLGAKHLLNLKVCSLILEHKGSDCLPAPGDAFEFDNATAKTVAHLS